jgi:predicted RNase H-like nuclease
MLISSWVDGSRSAGSADGRPSTCSRTGTAKWTGALKIDAK